MRIAMMAAVAALFVTTAAGAATDYPGWQSTIRYQTINSAGACGSTTAKACGFGNSARITTTVAYDPVTDTYTLRDTGSPTTKSSFGPGDISSVGPTFTIYSKNGGAETLRLLNPGVTLTYVTYGQWRRTSTSGSLTNVNDTYVVFGSKSPQSAVTSGTGNYTTTLDGTFVNKDGAYAVSGTGTFTANFAVGTGTISYSSTATGTPELGGSTINFGTLTGTGTINSRGVSFQGTGATNVSGYSMDVNGNFFGPTAQEIGGVFLLRGNRGTGTGAIVGN